MQLPSTTKTTTTTTPTKAVAAADGSATTTSSSSCNRKRVISWRIGAVVILLGGVLVADSWSGKNVISLFGVRENRASVGVMPASNAMESSRDFVVHELGYKTCRFVSFFDPSYHWFPLYGSQYVRVNDWRTREKQKIGVGDAYDVSQMIKYAAQLEQEYVAKSKQPVTRLKRRLTYVHIGKAGGSTVECSLRIKHGSHHCDNVDEDYDIIKRESAISRHVNCYTHWSDGLMCFYLQGSHPFRNMNATLTNTRHTISDSPEEMRGNNYLVNLRNPLDRLASWFVYEHSENHDAVYWDRDLHCGQIILNSCYRHFEDLITIGLNGPRPENLKKLRVGTDLNETECQDWAWATVTGRVPADYHNAYNYDWYAHRMLHDTRSNNADIFALRMEHLSEDWKVIDILLGGDGSIPPTLSKRQNSATNKELRVTNDKSKINNTVGVANLCRALCEEIQVYKQLLSRAVNLAPQDVEQSMEELRQQCPEEVDIDTRTCP